MRISGLIRRRRAELPIVLCVLVMTAVLAGCGGGGAERKRASRGAALARRVLDALESGGPTS